MENLEKKERYENAEIEVVTVDSNDVICTSGGNGGPTGGTTENFGPLGDI